MKAYFVSDIHLSDPEGDDGRAFGRFLKTLARDPAGTQLFLVGDIFDLWIGDHRYFQEKFGLLVAAIRKTVEAGVEVHYFEGNHDFHLRKFWETLGVNVHENAATFQIQGLKVRVEHGDLINPHDHGYLFLRWFLRTPPLKFLATRLPTMLVRRIGEQASRTSREYTSTAKELPVDEIRRLIREHAESLYKQEKFDLLVSGHVHVRDDVTLTGRARSVNLGSWFHDRKAFVLSKTGGEFIDL